MTRATKASPRGATKSRATKAQASDPPQDADDGPAIDEVLRRLDDVVGALEGGELPLEAALTRFEEGVRLVRRGAALLDAVEQRVEVLLADRDEVAPFTAEDDEEVGDDEQL
ncbi:MAG: exodeoxyribonuclease VII small subunit [Myxococcales bacterium]|nr:exodeoxyribonuclease VII small subunit [Myxococcales bacterium]